MEERKSTFAASSHVVIARDEEQCQGWGVHGGIGGARDPGGHEKGSDEHKQRATPLAFILLAMLAERAAVRRWPPERRAGRSS